MLATILLTALLQSANPCDTNASGPFIITTGRAFIAQWCTAMTQIDPATNQTVPVTIDGFYMSIDNAPRVDIAMALSLGTSTVTQRNAWQLSLTGVQKGGHTFSVIAYNFVRDQNGLPTSERQESAATSVPFSAVDPVFNLAPPAPTGARIIR